MQTFYGQPLRLNSPVERRNENNLLRYFSPRRKIQNYINSNIHQFYPYRKYVKNSPFPYCSLKKSSSNFNNSIHKTEEEKNCPPFKKLEFRQFFPLITRQNLMKYLKQNCSLQKSLPVINGRSSDIKFKIIHKYKTPTLSRNMSSDLRHKIINFNTEEKNRTLNVTKLHPIEESKNERNEECDKSNDDVKEKRNDKLLSLDKLNLNNIFYKPKKKTSFRKVQIFNHFKPFLVDEFREFAAY